MKSEKENILCMISEFRTFRLLDVSNMCSLPEATLSKWH